MNTQTVISLHNFSYADEKFFESLFNDLKASSNFPQCFNTIDTAEEMLDTIMSHWIEHNTSIGFLQDEAGVIIGIGGYYYLPDAEKYELLYAMLPLHTHNEVEALNMLVNKAFHGFGMDRLCARVLQSDGEDTQLKDAGFNYMGERSYESESHEKIWNYYEIYNDSDLVSAADVYINANTDWDSLF